MKILFTKLLFFLSVVAFGQTIKITVNTANSKCFDSREYNTSKFAKSIDSAFSIMTAVFNSTEFRSAIEKANFRCNNRCCQNCQQNNTVIDNKEILDSLFKELNVSMTIKLKQKCRNKLGATNYKEYKTIACLANIKADMPQLPLSYALAVNLCHECMHHIGFYHSSYDLSDIDNDTPNPNGYKNDIAYHVGWDVYRLLKKWHDTGVKIDGL
jgi:hypothetical protein